MLDGFHYILDRPGLLGLTLISLSFNLTKSLGYPLIAPMILARTGGNATLLGTVQAVMGFGGVAGAILISIWGGPKSRIHGILIGFTLTTLLGDMGMGLASGLIGWIIAGFCVEFFIPTAVGANIAIWQNKVAPEIQGRVFASRRVVAHTAGFIAMIIVGPLADGIFEPAMMPSGSLARIFGGVIPPLPDQAQVWR